MSPTHPIQPTQPPPPAPPETAMNPTVVRNVQILCAWCGPAFVVLYGLAWVVLGHNAPPPSLAGTGAQLVAGYYLKYRGQILLGQCLATCFGMLYLPWTCQLAVMMWLREKAPILSLLQLTGGLLTAWVLVFSPALWVWCAEMAPTLDPELIKAVHTLAWYVYDMTYMITTIQVIAICLFVFLDRAQPRIMPRWAGVLALFSGLSFLPLTFLPYFKTGLLAVNGYWSFHVAFVTYGLFTAIIGYHMARSLRR